LERISLNQLLIRIAPISTIKTDYEQLIITYIEQKFEHNLTQQVYLSDESWGIILTAKNATIQMTRMAAKKETIENANQMRELILNNLLEKQSPSNSTLSFIKEEVSDLWQNDFATIFIFTLGIIKTYFPPFLHFNTIKY
jgi:hypothetical protein